MKANEFKFNEEMISLIPPSSEADKEALTEDILSRVKMFGKDDESILIQDILLDPSGLVIDGRTRINICEELGLEIPESKIRKLKYGTSKKVIEMEVKSANIRRNLTLTQKAMTALRAYMTLKNSGEKGVSIGQVAKSWGVSKATLENAMYIHKRDEDMSNTLWKGNTVEIVNDKGYKTTTLAINSVCQHLKRLEEEDIDIEIPHDWNSFNEISTQKGRDKYKELIEKNNGTSLSYQIQKIIVSYLNEQVEPFINFIDNKGCGVESNGIKYYKLDSLKEDKGV